jgi:hypothetical protein
MNISNLNSGSEFIGMTLEQQRALLLMSVGSGPVNPDLIKGRSSSALSSQVNSKQLDFFA